MKILILDDQQIVFRAPESYFVDPHDYRNDQIVQVSHPAYFWEEYEQGQPWDEIWIDHDLGLPGYSGEDVTREFKRRAFYGETFTAEVIVTTMNPHAAKRMMLDLNRFGDIRAAARPIGFLEPLGVSRAPGHIHDRTKTLTRNL